MTNQVIPDSAIEAAARDLYRRYDYQVEFSKTHPATRARFLQDAKWAIEAAAPHMLAGAVALADEWESDGEEIMALSKRTLDEREATMCLMEGATMVENARLIRNAIGAAD